MPLKSIIIIKLLLLLTLHFDYYDSFGNYDC